MNRKDIHGKKFYGWRCFVEGKPKFGASNKEDIFDNIRKAMDEGRRIVIEPEDWGGKL